MVQSNCLFTVTFIVLGGLLRGVSSAACTEPSTISKEDADYVLIGLYPAYISEDSASGNGVMYMETVKYVLEQFNKQSPFKIGYRFYDTCGESNIHISAQISSDILLSAPSGTKPTCSCDNSTSNLDYVIGIVGPASSTVSEITANLLSLDELPLISYSSTSVKLNDVDRFPYFMRTIAADDYQSQVIFDLVVKFEWKYVSLIASDNLYGRSGTSELLELFKANGICLAVYKFFAVPYNNDDIRGIVNELKADQKAEVVIVWAVVSPTKLILDSASELGLRNRTWIFTEGVGKSNTITYRDPEVVKGAFSIIPYSGHSFGFESYFFGLTYPEGVAKYSEEYWLQKLFERYELQNDTLAMKYPIFQTHKIGIIWNSVTAYLNSLTAYVADQKKNASSTSGFPRIADRKSFFEQYLKKVKFSSLDGETFEFNELGNVKNQRYKILNVHVHPNDTSLQEIGFWNRGNLTLNDSHIMWSGNKRPRSLCSDECREGFYPLLSNKVCCWKCVKCQKGYFKAAPGQVQCQLCPLDTLPNENKTKCMHYNHQKAPYGQSVTILVFILSSFAGLLILFTLVVFCCFRQEKIVKALNFPLSIIQLTAQFIIISCGFFMTIEVTWVRCALYHYMTSFFTILVLAVILIKTEMVLRIFNMRRRMSQREIFGEVKRLFKILIAVLSAYIILHGLLWDQFPVRVVEELEVGTSTFVRSCKNSVQIYTSGLCILVLSMVCSVQVFRNRKLPSLFNEGKVIMYAVFVLDVGILVILMVALIVQRDQQALVTYYVIYASNTWVFFVMFSGKVYRLVLPCIKRKKMKSSVEDSCNGFCIYDKNRSKNSKRTFTNDQVTSPPVV